MPSILMVMTTSVYSIIDGLFVSNYVGTTPFAALNLIWPSLAIIGSLGMMVGTGGAALVSKVMGEGHLNRANRIFSMLIQFLVLLGLLLSAITYIFLDKIILLLGADEAMVHDCMVYGSIITMGLPVFMLQLAFQSFYMTAEMPRLGTLMTVVCGVINIALDALFIVVFGWGLVGAAVASVLAMAVGGLFPVIFFSSRFNHGKLHFSRSVFEWKDIRQTCFNGMSEYINQVAFSVICICYNLQLMKYIGESGVVAYGIILYQSFVCASVFIGYNIGITPIIGFNYGAKNYDELKSLLRKSIVVIFVAGFLLTAIAELCADVTSGIFVGYDVELEKLTAHAIRLNMISFLVFGINLFISTWFTSLNNGLISAIISFSHTLVFEVGCIFVLPLFLGLDGIWLAIDFADVLSLGVALWLLFAYRRRYHY